METGELLLIATARMPPYFLKPKGNSHHPNLGIWLLSSFKISELCLIMLNSIASAWVQILPLPLAGDVGLLISSVHVSISSSLK
jgi:hypothetical protein